MNAENVTFQVVVMFERLMAIRTGKHREDSTLVSDVPDEVLFHFVGFEASFAFESALAVNLELDT